MSTVLITGANRGLGLELVRQYAADGWQVLAAARRSSEALAALAAGPGAIRCLTVDVADDDSVGALAAELSGEAIDVLLNNAGVYGKVPFADGGVEDQAFGHTDYDDWVAVMQVNTFGPMRMAEAFIDHVLASEQKKIVTLSSVIGSIELNTIGGLYRYRSSKAAVNAVMKSMAIDLLPRGVLAVALHPGWARTAMGGPNADIDAQTSVAGVRRVIAGLTAEQLGHLIAYDGAVLPY